VAGQHFHSPGLQHLPPRSGLARTLGLAITPLAQVDETFPPELRSGLWHTTNSDRFARIVAVGQILPEPDLPDSERWKTGGGVAHYPYVRSIGGVSLFDFTDFDPESYSKDYPLSDWHVFVPYRRSWRNSVWIQVDRDAISDHFVSGLEVLMRRRRDKAYGHDFMPLIEAASLAPIPVTTFRRVLIRGEDFPTFQPYAHFAGQ
jgi:hypothetical protein